jgi:hypothetical protein
VTLGCDASSLTIKSVASLPYVLRSVHAELLETNCESSLAANSFVSGVHVYLTKSTPYGKGESL